MADVIIVLTLDILASTSADFIPVSANTALRCVIMNADEL